MEQNDLCMGPELLERFVDQFEVDGERFCCANVEEAACCFRKYFDLPTPMALAHASEFIYRFYDVRDSQQNKCSSPRSLPSRLCGSDFSRQPKWNSLILESPLNVFSSHLLRLLSA